RGSARRTEGQAGGIKAARAHVGVSDHRTEERVNGACRATEVVRDRRTNRDRSYVGIPLRRSLDVQLAADRQTRCDEVHDLRIEQKRVQAVAVTTLVEVAACGAPAYAAAQHHRATINGILLCCH